MKYGLTKNVVAQMSSVPLKGFYIDSMAYKSVSKRIEAEASGSANNKGEKSECTPINCANFCLRCSIGCGMCMLRVCLGGESKGCTSIEESAEKFKGSERHVIGESKQENITDTQTKSGVNWNLDVQGYSTTNVQIHYRSVLNKAVRTLKLTLENPDDFVLAKQFVSALTIHSEDAFDHEAIEVKALPGLNESKANAGKLNTPEPDVEGSDWLGGIGGGIVAKVKKIVLCNFS
jgi:hypothetical protein